MEIIVQGKGTKYIKPNEVVLNLTFTNKAKTYDVVLSDGIRSVNYFVEEILLKNGFSKDELKTRSFVINEEKKYDEKMREYIDAGYSFNQVATLKFDYNMELLSNLILAISEMTIAPTYYIKFGVKDEEECRNEALAKAYQNAYNQALAIAASASKNLRYCQKVDFQPISNNYYSPAEFSSSFMRAKAINNDMIINSFTPEDIEISETLYCSWIAD